MHDLSESQTSVGSTDSGSTRDDADMDDDDSAAPGNFLCPILHTVMRDPVIAADGYTYEQSAIADWLTRKNLSPMVRRMRNGMACGLHLIDAGIGDASRA